jgi:formate C-acetyltransferase
VIRTGFAGIRAEASARLDQCAREGNREGRAFCEAVLICCDAIREFAGRYAKLARDKAKRIGNPKRKQELLAIAERCEHVPEHPPRDFKEAVQFLWLTQCGALIAYGMGGIFAIGRADQYLYPFYERDLKAGTITRDDALEYIEELLIKLSYNLIILPAIGKNTGSELGADNQAVTVGGVGPDGPDATNELSFLFLEAVMNLRSLSNSFSIRLSEKSSDEWALKSAEVFSVTSGAAVFNDEVLVESLAKTGYTQEEARDYAIIGCVEPSSDGNTFGCTSGNDISLTGALEMCLNHGWLWIVGRQVGPDTGDPCGFETFEQLMTAYKRQVSFMIDTVARGVRLKDQVYAEGFHNPFVSATLEGCLKNATDMTCGGAKHNFSSITARGLGTAADSLAAIKAMVFDRKKYTMAELLGALKNNFRSKEVMRQMLLNRAPKFGCDDDEPDDIAREVAEYFCREVARRRGYRKDMFRPGFFSYGMHVAEGAFLGATANGRKAGEPVSNSLSPTNGSERKGSTAVMRSLAKIDQTLISNGCALNIKLLPSVFSKGEGVRALAGLIKGYFASGGMEVQFNVVDNATLRDAQAHPERYRDLVVRVSGYSAYFTDLGKAIQDEIIARTCDGL